MTARKVAHSSQRAKGALASGIATADLHHARGHDRVLLTPAFRRCNLCGDRDRAKILSVRDKSIRVIARHLPCIS
jgi:hypothetical protein